MIKTLCFLLNEAKYLQNNLFLPRFVTAVTAVTRKSVTTLALDYTKALK